MKNKNILFWLCIFLIFVLIPSSFAIDLNESHDDISSNSLDSTQNILSYENNVDSNISDDLDVVRSSNNDYVSNSDTNSLNDDLLNGIDDGKGICVESDTINMSNSHYINGSLYEVDNEWNMVTFSSIVINYSYIGNDGITHTGSVVTDSNDDAKFSIDLSTLSGLDARSSPYVITLSCYDENYYDLCYAYPDSVNVTVYVSSDESGINETNVSNNVFYVATDGNDENSGLEDSPFASIEKAVATAIATNSTCDIMVKEGTYTLSSLIEAYDVNIIGLGNVVFDLDNQNYGFSTKYDFFISNIMFKNGYGTTYGASVVKSVSTEGKSLTVKNCTFVNCTGYNGAAICTYYGGAANLNVTDCTFINCVAYNFGGAIAVSNSKTGNIFNCSFINCSSAKSGGAIYFANAAGGSSVNYCIFANNTASNNSGNDIYSKGLINADYNYWGYNSKVSSEDAINVTCDKWVLLDVDADLSIVAVGEETVFNFDFTKYSDGNANYTLEYLLQDLTVDLSSDLGSFDKSTITTSNGLATAIYTPSSVGYETVGINVPSRAENISFEVIDEISNLIFVAKNGSDSKGSGSNTNPYATITYALTKVNNTKNTIYVKKGTYNEHDMEITKSVTIMGENTELVFIDAEENGRIFLINDDVNVTLKSISLTNAKVDYYNDDFDIAGIGGAICLSDGNLILNKTSIYNSSSAAGGAIGVCAGSSGSVSIYDSYFENNSLDSDAEYSGYSILSGGAVYSDSDLIIVNSTFVNNNADDAGSYNGGAVSVGETATIRNSTFINNSAEKGGAISVEAFNSSNVNIYNNTFEFNNASSGGAVYSSMSKLTSIYDNEFDNNTASSYAGAIYVEGSKTFTLIDSNVFNGNVAKYGNVLALKYAKLNLSNNIMENNGLLDDDNNINSGDIYYISGNLSTVLSFIDNSTLKVVGGESVNLTALLTDDMGNTISNANINFTLDDENIGSAITDNNGVASLIYKTNETIDNYTVSGSFIGSSGEYSSNLKTGLLIVSKYYWFIDSQGYFTLQDAVDASNEGDVITGLPGIYYYDEIAIGSRINNISRNVTIKADNLGDIILIGHNGRLFNVAAKNDYNDTHKASSLTLINMIVENSTDEYGGAIYNDAYLILENCIFRNNHAITTDSSSKWHGGAIMSWGDLKIKNCTFVNNTALSGAAINTEALRGNVTIVDSVFENNVASGSIGGAIYASGISSSGSSYDYFIMDNCTFINNSAGAGGAIYTNTNTTINNTRFINNTASVSGGALVSYKGDLIFNNSYVEGSSAEKGGALCLLQNIISYYTSENGTSIKTNYLDYYFLLNSIFVNNNASLDGGAIFIGNSTLANGFIDNCSFINNSALFNGGAIANYISNATIIQSKFINNTASGNGGTLYNYGRVQEYSDIGSVEYCASMFVYDSSFENSVASNGGFISNENCYSYLTVDNSTFNNSYSNYYGGVIYNIGFLNISNTSMFNASSGLSNSSSKSESDSSDSTISYGDYIYNDGVVGCVYIKFLNNETVYHNIYDESPVIINATVTDDMGNNITGRTVQFVINGNNVSDVNLSEGIAFYEFTVPSEGNYSVSGSYAGYYDDMYVVYNGLILTYVPTFTNFLFDDDELYIYDNFTIQLVDNETNPLFNKSVKINITSSNGLNVTDLEFITDDNGFIILDYFDNTGEYNISGIFYGDMDYAFSNFNTSFEVNKINSTLTIENTVISSGDKISLILSAFNGTPIANKTLNVSIVSSNADVKNYILTTDDNGYANISSLTKGNYILKANFEGDLIYQESSILSNIKVNEKAAVSIVHTGDDNRDIQEAIDNANPGDVIDLGNYNYTNVNHVNITKNITIKGNNTSITSSEDADCIFYIVPQSEISDFGLDDAADDVNITNIEFNLSNGTVAVLTKSEDVNNLYSDISSINITNNTFKLANDNTSPDSIDVLKVETNSTNFNPNNPISVTNNTLVSGMKPFELYNTVWNNQSGDIYIPQANPIETSLTIEHINTGSGDIIITLKDINNNPLTDATIIYSINGTNYTATTDDNGELIISHLTGDSNIQASFEGNSSYTSSNATIIVNSTYSEKRSARLIFDNMTTSVVLNGARDGQWFNATLVDSETNTALANKTIQIGFNGKIYTKTTNASGQVSLQINIGYQSANTFSLSFLGDEEYNGTVGVAMIVVKPLNTTITSSKTTYKSYAKTKTIKATLKTSNGTLISNKKITFTVNGKTYIAKTNSKGVASVNVSLTKKGTYKYTAKFDGDNQYSSKSTSSKLIIK